MSVENLEVVRVKKTGRLAVCHGCHDGTMESEYKVRRDGELLLYLCRKCAVTIAVKIMELEVEP